MKNRSFSKSDIWHFSSSGNTYLLTIMRLWRDWRNALSRAAVVARVQLCAGSITIFRYPIHFTLYWAKRGPRDENLPARRRETHSTSGASASARARARVRPDDCGLHCYRNCICRAYIAHYHIFGCAPQGKNLNCRQSNCVIYFAVITEIAADKRIEFRGGSLAVLPLLRTWIFNQKLFSFPYDGYWRCARCVRIVHISLMKWP